jgi:hypothetical protein
VRRIKIRDVLNAQADSPISNMDMQSLVTRGPPHPCVKLREAVGFRSSKTDCISTSLCRVGHNEMSFKSIQTTDRIYIMTRDLPLPPHT